MTQPFGEVAREVYVLRYPVLDVNVTLVVGAGRALVVDTLSTDAQAASLRSAVRGITRLPLCVVNTHHHFDHWFGNGVVAGPDTEVWAHEEAAARLARRLEEQREAWVVEWARLDPELAAGMATATLRPPNRTVHMESTVDLGDRTVVLRHLGRGHTDGDLVVLVPDADVVLAGDLVEQGGPPMFGDGYPLEWPETLAALLRLMSPATTVVPGHGALVDVDFVHAQHDQLTALAWLIRDGHFDGAPVKAVAAKVIEALAAKAPLDADTALVAVKRGYAELSGHA
jgi:glyoxylase-like metal-dependent hydrolase (beta-lactamase superfamily II)